MNITNKLVNKETRYIGQYEHQRMETNLCEVNHYLYKFDEITTLAITALETVFNMNFNAESTIIAYEALKEIYSKGKIHVPTK